METSVKIISASYLRREGFKMQAYTIAPKIPLEINDETGRHEIYGVTDLTKVVDQNIKMTLLTSPGERIMNPAFGVGLKQYLFENDTTITRGSGGLPPLRENILSQLSTFVPYIAVQDLQINISADSNLMNIKIKYFVNDSNTSSVFDLTINEVNDNVL